VGPSPDTNNYLLLDVSGSMGYYIAQCIKSVSGILNGLHDNTWVALSTFNSEMRTLTPLTLKETNIKKIQKDVLHCSEMVGGSTSFYRAVYKLLNDIDYDKPVNLIMLKKEINILTKLLNY